MRLEDSYRGVTLNFRYDRETDTFIGFMEGLSVAASVQATTYEGLVEAFREAVDMHLGDRLIMSRLRARQQREAVRRPEATVDWLQQDDDPIRAGSFFDRRLYAKRSAGDDTRWSRAVRT